MVLLKHNYNFKQINLTNDILYCHVQYSVKKLTKILQTIIGIFFRFYVAKEQTKILLQQHFLLTSFNFENNKISVCP